MVLRDSNDQFNAELNRKIEGKKITSQEFIDFMKSHGTPEGNRSGFYDLCSKFADISLNAPKKANLTTCDVQACFRFCDINIAKSAFHEFVRVNKLIDIEGLLEAVQMMHTFAVDGDDPRLKGVMIRPEDYDWEPGFAGKYHNFCQLPDDILNQIKDEFLKETML